MKYNVFLIALVPILISCKSAQRATKEFIPNFSVSKKTTHKIPEGQDYTFGYLEVLENRENPNSSTIKLPLYYFKSRSKNPKKDPIIYTVGGPGSSTMRSAQYMNYYQYLDDRDFILIEQRGTYYAQPHLDCPEWSKAVYESNLPDFDESRYDTLFAKAATACKNRLTKKDIDLNAYNTTTIAADINDLVNALGIEQYNLLTISYSTKIAQVLLRDYPDKIRSVVMDSTLPLEVNYGEESITNLMVALDMLLSDCAADASCNKAFPDLKKRFSTYLLDKTENPLRVTVENPKTNKQETFYLKGEDLIAVFTRASTGDVPNIPLEINKLLNNDLTSIKEQLTTLFNEPGGGAGMGMRLSVWCAEETPFNDPKKISNASTTYPEVRGVQSEVFTTDICDIWGVKKVADIENQPITSDVPVLFINGEYDEVTTASWASAMLPNFSNGYHVVFKGWKHNATTNWVNQCAMEAANAFFNNPTVQPNPECISEIKSPEFKTE